ncbi:hypothetical protein CH352_17340 [Leptospira hartskeerlii]|uniref:1-phosphatidylinositol phosphodiesterase n=2 Tax=Leptospira hartskeerlii TaxID=2023177 RepID=A0A2M9XDC2_9LEPT|nr:hypothetical protein CH357_11625 [Leptospira hartskeerlii]PJZ32170.1 hypothetical protein CH352_17340 [Leptospira hartskeerlii]
MLSNSPSAIVYNGLLYCFYRSSLPDQFLYYNIFDGKRWRGVKTVGGPSQEARLSGSPSAVVFGSKLYVFYQGCNNEGYIWFSVFDGQKWSGNEYLGGAQTKSGITDSPSAVIFQDKLYVFHHGFGDNGQVWCRIFNGVKWTPDTEIKEFHGITDSPSAVVFQYGLWIFHQGRGTNSVGKIYLVQKNSTEWFQDKQLEPYSGISSSPSAVVFQDKLHVFHQGEGRNGQVWLRIFNNGRWENDQRLAHCLPMMNSPFAVVFQNKLYLLHQMANLLYFSTFDGKTWSPDQIALNNFLSWTPSPEKWMEEIGEDLKNVPLNELIIPGTHDSATSAIDTYSGFSEEVSPLLNALYALLGAGAVVARIVAIWAKTQSVTIGKQLSSGIRYLDIRISKRKDRGGELWTTHTLWSCRFSEVLDDIGNFAAAHPKEILFLELGNFQGMQSEDHDWLIQELKRRFGEKLIPSSVKVNATVGRVWQMGKNIIFFYKPASDKDDTNFWSTELKISHWPNVTTLDNLNSKLIQDIQNRDKTKFLVTQALLTIGGSGPPITNIGASAEDVAKETNRKLLEWIRLWPAENLNIIEVDFFDNCEFTNLITRMNGRST